jgi:hypothetical protein
VKGHGDLDPAERATLLDPPVQKAQLVRPVGDRGDHALERSRDVLDLLLDVEPARLLRFGKRPIVVWMWRLGLVGKLVVDIQRRRHVLGTHRNHVIVTAGAAACCQRAGTKLPLA